jgi:hypothetical protein
MKRRSLNVQQASKSMQNNDQTAKEKLPMEEESGMLLAVL